MRGAHYNPLARYGSCRAGWRPQPHRSPGFPTPIVPFGERVPLGSALLPANYCRQLRTQFGRSRHHVGSRQVRELRGYRRHLLRTPERGTGLLPLLQLQKLEKVLKVKALAPIQGTLMALDRTQEPLEATGEFEKFAPRIVRLSHHAHARLDATACHRGEVVSGHR
jgi:hypothetical protein